MTLALHEILASLLNEFQSANYSSEVNRAHWQEIYQNSPLLNEFTPSRVRIADATVCMPLILENIEELQTDDYGITPRQIALALPDRTGENRLQKATAVFDALVKRNKHNLLNPHLADDVLDMIKVQCKCDLSDTELADIQRKIQQIQQEFLTRPHASRVAQFTYRTGEVAQVQVDRLFKFEIRIIVD